MNDVSPPAIPAGITDTLSRMSAAEISAVDVVLRCLLCERFSECETARALVQEPLMLVDYDQESRQ